MKKTIKQLEYKSSFVKRHIGPSRSEQNSMLLDIGSSSLENLIEQVVPKDVRLESTPIICESVTEEQAIEELKVIASKNKCYKNYIGIGYYSVITPPVILRNVLENPGWYTSYTPYQPEISQGRLETLLNFQHLTLDLTGLDIASASLLDEATAAAEAMVLANRANKNKEKSYFFVSEDIHPQTLDVVRTRAETFGFKLIIDKPWKALEYEEIFGILLQQIGTTGNVYDFNILIEKLREKKVIICIAADLMALVLLNPPKGADIIFGSSQRFGVPMGYGGPYAAFFSVREKMKRLMPGRIIGISRDVTKKNTALRMAMQTREQHIRRENATSNICTSQVLMANIASLYAIYHGPVGLNRIATRIHRMTTILAKALHSSGFKLQNKCWFDTITVEVYYDKWIILTRAKIAHMNFRNDLHNAIGISLDETTSRSDIQKIWEIFTGKNERLNIDYLDTQCFGIIPKHLLRNIKILSHKVFNSFHSETNMMRYIHRLVRKDLALNQSMIPLGSCTMKLNSVSEMLPMTWENFSNLHPFCPIEQATGYRYLIAQLSNWLKKLTGYDALCMQPNSGAQGEYAGLLTIRRYHESLKQTKRNICLIPISAHGTNPASAKMAGMLVVTIACDIDGNIDFYDLKLKAKIANKKLSCIMITYPSTHGVYEENIRKVCDIIHYYGGQVYLDGANMNAQIGITSPGYIGADVSHINLHKTFCIPHGGGGPGAGPIGVKKHLIPFLPGHSVVQIDGMTKLSAVSSAPFGNASILPISWMYIRMMGTNGLKNSSQVAILNANYIASKLIDHYPVLYTGCNNRIAHECILDIRPLKKVSGINEIDISKRLIDYGFHAPTMSFPVIGTLMIEPTESESKEELDRFIDAMIDIRAEIQNIIDGVWPITDNPLINAPHTQQELSENHWEHPYNRQIAAFPTKCYTSKYWPTVKRLDDAYGDRNLCCVYTSEK